MYISCDVAGPGKDRTVMIVWNGYVGIDFREFRKMEQPDIIIELKALQAEYKVPLKNIVVDNDGMSGIVSTIKCTGFVNGSKAVDPAYLHLKAQCYYLASKAINDRIISFDNEKFKPVRDQIIKQFEWIKRHRPDADGKLNVTPKEEIKRKYGASPDHADAIMMRMYYAVYPNLGKYIFSGA